MRCNPSGIQKNIYIFNSFCKKEQFIASGQFITIEKQAKILMKQQSYLSSKKNTIHKEGNCK